MGTQTKNDGPDGPGWYPIDDGRERYWTGDHWDATRYTAEATAADRDHISPGGVALAVFVPPAGLIYAVVKFASGQLRAGVSATAIALIMMLLGMMLVEALS